MNLEYSILELEETHSYRGQKVEGGGENPRRSYNTRGFRYILNGRVQRDETQGLFFRFGIIATSEQRENCSSHGTDTEQTKLWEKAA